MPASHHVVDVQWIFGSITKGEFFFFEQDIQKQIQGILAAVAGTDMKVLQINF